MANVVEILLRLGGAGQMQSQLKGVQGAFASIQSQWRSLNGLLGSVGIAVGIGAAIRSMWNAAEEARVATLRLTTALTASGQAAEGVAASMMLQAEALETLTGVSDETVMAIQSMLLSMGATAEQATKLTPLVLDVSAAMGTDATTAARQLGQALDGQQIQLGRLNIKVKSFDELLVVLNDRVKGQASALHEAKGAAASLSVEIGRLSELTGEWLSQAASPLLERFKAAVQSVNQDLFGKFAYRNMPPMTNIGLRPLNQGPTSFPGQQFTGTDVESSAIEGERTRQAEATQALVRIEADLNNQYAFRRALIEQDPNMTEADRRAGLVAVLRDEVQVQQQLEDLRREEFQRQLQADPGRTLETTIDAERQLGDAQLRRLQITQQIQSLSEADTFGGKLRQNLRGLVDEFGNLQTSLANTTFQTVTNAVEGLSGALTAVIMGTKTAGQAFAQFGMQLLTSFIQSILTAVIYAEIALPILSALGVASGGASFGAGVPIVAAGLAAGTAAGAAAARGGGRKAGGYTGDGPVDQVAGYHHRGEFIFPASRVRELGVANLESMAFGGSTSAGGGDRPLQVVVMDDRRGLDRIMRDPRFRSFVVDLAREA